MKKRDTENKKEEEEDEEKLEIVERVLLFLINRPERKLVCVNSILSSCLVSLFFLAVRVASSLTFQDACFSKEKIE